jgi:flagellar basal-body rod protein FlgB
MLGGFKSLKLLEMSLDASAVRRDVIANNIANVDVPGFKRSEVVFEAELKRAIESQRRFEEEEPLHTTQPGHIARRPPRRIEDVRPAVHIDYNSTMRNDGNNVDIEDEVMKMVRNQLHFNLIADRISGKFSEWNGFIRMA